MTAAIAIAFLAGMSGQTIESQLARSPADVAMFVKVKGDALDPQITVSTEGVTVVHRKGLLASSTEENSFLRAFISKKDKSVTAQIYHAVIDAGRTAPNVYQASVETDKGPEQFDARQVGYDVNCGRYVCTHYEDVVVTVPIDLLRKSAAFYSASNPARGLKYRLYGRSGATFDDAIPVNEIAGFIQVVDEELAKLNN